MAFRVVVIFVKEAENWIALEILPTKFANGLNAKVLFRSFLTKCNLRLFIPNRTLKCTSSYLSTHYLKVLWLF